MTFAEFLRRETKENLSSYRHVSRSAREFVIKRDNYTCQMCGKHMPDRKGLVIDHIKPVSKRGRGDIDNLQVLCVACNCAKGTKYEGPDYYHRMIGEYGHFRDPFLIKWYLDEDKKRLRELEKQVIPNGTEAT